MKDPVHLICATNASFIMPLCVLLASVVDHFEAGRLLVIHVISNDALARDRENVRTSLEMNRPGLLNLEIHWYSVEDAQREKLPTKGHFSTDTYARLFAPVLLPESCERAIYLDCDMVVLADIAGLYDSTNDDSIIHAVQDIGNYCVSMPDGVFDFAERGIPPETRCFNGGVLVINLKKWRERNLTSALLDYLAKNGEHVFVDQGALNAFLCREWKPLDTRWNAGSDALFYDMWAEAGYSRDEWLRAINNPYVIHFSGSKKPWQRGRYAPRYSYFNKYLQRTVYKDSLPHRSHLEDVIGFPIYYQLWKWTRRISGAIKS